MLPRAYVAVVVIAAALIGAACGPPSNPISVNEHTLVIENRTSRDWRNVRVTVNDHFGGGAALVAAGSRLTAPLSQFQTAFGQRFDLERQAVVKVEVIATDSKGEAVKLELKR